MQTLLQDLKHALRMFRESPAFTLTAVAALTIGIGANTAIFSVVNAVVLKPIPFADPDRMVMLLNSNRETGNAGGGGSPAKFMHWRAQIEVLEDVTAYRNNSLNYTAGDIPVREFLPRREGDDIATILTAVLAVSSLLFLALAGFGQDRER